MSISWNKGGTCKQFTDLGVQIFSTVTVCDVLRHRKSVLLESLAFEDTCQFPIELRRHQFGRVMNRRAQEERQTTIFDQSNDTIEMRIELRYRRDGALDRHCHD